MKLGIVDSTVVVHLYRRRISSLEWLQLQPGRHLVTPITWLETLVGAGSKRAMMDAEAILRRFQVVHFTSSDQTWSIEQMGLLRLSRGVHTNDCLIASVAHRLQVPIYTQNVKDFLKLLPAELVIKPYTE